jgi:hypothetical protein
VIEGTRGYSEPQISSVLVQGDLRRIFDVLNDDESALPWTAASLAAGPICKAIDFPTTNSIRGAMSSARELLGFVSTQKRLV